MSKKQILIILGIWVMIFLFLGFPSSWDRVLALVSGAGIIIFTYKIDSNTRISTNTDAPFVEHKTDRQNIINNKII